MNRIEKEYVLKKLYVLRPKPLPIGTCRRRPGGCPSPLRRRPMALQEGNVNSHQAAGRRPAPRGRIQLFTHTPLQFQWLSYLLLLPGSGCTIIQQTLILQESWRGQTPQCIAGICCGSAPRIWLASSASLHNVRFYLLAGNMYKCWTAEAKPWSSPPTNKTWYHSGQKENRQ